MKQHDDGLSLKQMLAHAREAIAMTSARKRVDLDNDRMLELALTRLVEIVGEAATRVTRETQGRLVAIPWPQVIGMRNRLIHGCDKVDLDVLWDTIQIDLPPLIQALHTALDDGPLQ